ncbi:MAG TPA: MATE family efflux transporter [Nevskiaceae bacterium]|nr:MATE family efflux transporter [Nevskiaceae bacterium]
MNMNFRREAADNLRLALPLLAAQLLFISMGVVDTLMAGRLGGAELAAIAVGSNVWMQLFVFFMGVCMACSPIVAQREGAGEAPRSIGAFVRGCLPLGLVFGLVWTLTGRVLAWPVISHLGLTPATADLAYRYTLAETWGGPAFALCFVLRSSAEGLGQTRVVLAAGVVALASKIGANILFVHGGAGVPALGVVGLGWGTVASALTMLLSYVAQFSTWRRLRELQVFSGPLRPRPDALELVVLGLPIGLILFAEAAFFCCTALLMARFGDAAVAAHQIAINVASVSFMAPLSIGFATTVRVGNAMGAGARADALARGRAGMLMGLCFALLSAAVMALGARGITALYTGVPDVGARAATFLRYAALFQLFDCLQATANGALRGIKDTRVPMLVTITAYWLVGMPCAWLLAFHFQHGPVALWWGFIIGLALAACGLSLRFLSRAGRTAN